MSFSKLKQTGENVTKRQYGGVNGTSPGPLSQKKTRHDTNDRRAMANAIKNCTAKLTQDASYEHLEDFLIEKVCLTVDECERIRQIGQEKERVRHVIILITKKSFNVMYNFVMVLGWVYRHLAENILHEFNTIGISDNRNSITNSSGQRNRSLSKNLCPICKLKNAVNVEVAMDVLYSKAIIGDKLFEKIHATRGNVGNQEDLWNDVLTACQQNKGTDVLLNVLEEHEHFTHITTHLQDVFKDKLTENQFCTCQVTILYKESVDICKTAPTSDYILESEKEAADMKTKHNSDDDRIILPNQRYDTLNDSREIQPEKRNGSRIGTKAAPKHNDNMDNALGILSNANGHMHSLTKNRFDPYPHKARKYDECLNRETGTKQRNAELSTRTGADAESPMQMQVEAETSDILKDPLINDHTTNQQLSESTTEQLIIMEDYYDNTENEQGLQRRMDRNCNNIKEWKSKHSFQQADGFRQMSSHPTTKAKLKRPGRFKAISSALGRLSFLRRRQADNNVNPPSPLPIDISTFTGESLV